MRKAVLAFSFLSLSTLACSSAPTPEPTGTSGDALGWGPVFNWLAVPPTDDYALHSTAALVLMPDVSCPNIPVDDGMLLGRTGYDWMTGWGKGSPLAYYQGVWQIVESENSAHLTPLMILGWQRFCAYSFQPTGKAASFDLPVPARHYADLVSLAQATDIEPAITPYWKAHCPALHAPCPNDPCTCPPVD